MGLLARRCRSGHSGCFVSSGRCDLGPSARCSGRERTTRRGPSRSFTARRRDPFVAALLQYDGRDRAEVAGDRTVTVERWNGGSKEARKRAASGSYPKPLVFIRPNPFNRFTKSLWLARAAVRERLFVDTMP